MNAVVDALAKSAKAEDEAPSGIIAALAGFFSPEAGQARRAWLDGQGEAALEYVPPELRPWVGAADMMNPISDIGRAGQASTRMMAPGATPGERFGAGVDMVTDMASVLAPAIGMKLAGKGSEKALQEALINWSSSADDAAGEAADAWRRFAADDAGGLTLPGSRSQADEIAEMLAQGRAGEVTDDMMAAADPSELWRLYEGGKTGQAMPMDAASRMQRADGMGFDTGTPLYHGTSADFQAFDQRMFGKRDEGFAGRGVYSTDEPMLAEEYGGAIIPHIRASSKDFVVNPERGISSEGYDTVLDRFGVSRERDLSGANSAKLTSNASSEGYEGVWINDRLGDEVAAEVVTFDPANIRSKFARFDPRLKHLANLSAAGAGVAYMGGQDDDLMDETRAWLEGLK